MCHVHGNTRHKEARSCDDEDRVRAGTGGQWLDHEDITAAPPTALITLLGLHSLTQYSRQQPRISLDLIVSPVRFVWPVRCLENAVSGSNYLEVLIVVGQSR